MVENDGETQIAQSRVQHVKKRSLKNKSLSVSFNEKDLRDYVTGFHKRKKKRRKEAEKQQEGVLRRKRIEARKKRKEERDFALFGAPPATDGSVDEPNDDHVDDEEMPIAIISGTTMYDDGSVKVTVTTSEVSREEEITDKPQPQPATAQLFAKDKKHNLPITKKKLLKKVVRQKSRPKPLSKRDKRKKGRNNK